MIRSQLKFQAGVKTSKKRESDIKGTEKRRQTSEKCLVFNLITCRHGKCRMIAAGRRFRIYVFLTGSEKTVREIKQIVIFNNKVTSREKTFTFINGNIGK